MTTRVRCWCDLCGTEMLAEKLRPVFTVQRASTRDLMWGSMPGEQADQQWRTLKLGDGCGACLERLTREFHAAPTELDPGIVDRILGGMDA
jgi:hypothetical protein